MSKFIQKANKIEELFIGYLLLILAVVTFVQVVLRYSFGISFDWVEEGSRYLLITIAFIGAGICIRYGIHFRMDAVIQFSPNRIKHLLNAVSNFVSCMIMFVVSYYGWIQVVKLYNFGTTSPALKLPMFVAYLPIVIFSIVISFRFLFKAAESTKGMILNIPIAPQKGGH